MIAVLCSTAALPTTATTITPRKTGVMPKVAPASLQTEPTRISLTHAMTSVAPANTSTDFFKLQAALWGIARFAAVFLAGKQLFYG